MRDDIDTTTNSVNTAENLHQQAMEMAEKAFVAKLAGQEFEGELRQALDFESRAADLIAPYIDLEPSRAILHKSAASLALDCKDYDLAGQLLHRALNGNPPPELHTDLCEMLQSVSYSPKAVIMDRPKKAKVMVER